jgi:hypothetical protein
MKLNSNKDLLKLVLYQLIRDRCNSKLETIIHFLLSQPSSNESSYSLIKFNLQFSEIFFVTSSFKIILLVKYLDICSI